MLPFACPCLGTCEAGVGPMTGRSCCRGCGYPEGRVWVGLQQLGLMPCITSDLWCVLLAGRLPAGGVAARVCSWCD